MKKVKCLIGKHDWEEYTYYEKFAGMDTQGQAKRCKRCGKAERIQ